MGMIHVMSTVVSKSAGGSGSGSGSAAGGSSSSSSAASAPAPSIPGPAPKGIDLEEAFNECMDDGLMDFASASQILEGLQG